MRKYSKVGRNQSCPCGSGKKYKGCCIGKVDWNKIARSGEDYISHVSVRGRNILFINDIADILQLDRIERDNISDYKNAFTKNNVRRIHEAVISAWPPDTNIDLLLKSQSSDVSGLYIGDYDLKYILRGIIRHSIYSNKILVVDPFIYHFSVRDEFNPIISPEKYINQTLKNVNFWLAITPWVKAGILEVIRTPADFDPQLNWESMIKQKNKFETDSELMEASKKTVKEWTERHLETLAQRMLILSAPDNYLESKFEELEIDKDGVSFEDFLKYINKLREKDLNVIDPNKFGPHPGQLHMMSTGTSYDIAQLTASLTKSYLVTDLFVRWREIEIDRSNNNVESRIWSPLAKAFQESPLKFLSNLSLHHAMKIRNEGHLESLRKFLLRVWKSARTEDHFDDINVGLLAEELREEVALAKEEWRKIDDDLLKIIGGEAAAGLLAAGPLIESGHGLFLGASAVTAGAATLAAAYRRRKRFPCQFPAAFFMNIENST